MTVPSIVGYASLVEVSSGASSTVYRAGEPEHGRQVAIKVLKSASLGPAERLAFEREVKAMGQLSAHPYIVDLIGSGFTDEGKPYIVMPYYQNGTYGEWVNDEGPMAWRDLLDFGVKVASALETAHRRGFIHRDIKPANIYRGEFVGQPILADFGVSSFVAPGLDDAGTVTIAGTPLYLAPEIFEGVRPNAGTDVYALASTFYSLLEGRAAYQRSSMEMVVAAVTSNEPPPPVTTEAPDEVHDLLARAMAKDPNRRPPTALALVGELNAIQRAHDLLVTPPMVQTADTSTGPIERTGPTGSESLAEFLTGPAPSTGMRLDNDPGDDFLDGIDLSSVELSSIDQRAGGQTPGRSQFAPPGESTADIDTLDRPTEPIGDRPIVRPRPRPTPAGRRPGWLPALAVALLGVAGIAAYALWTGQDPVNPTNDLTADLVVTETAWTEDFRLVGEVAAHPGLISAVAWSPDGSTVATGDFEGQITLWSVSSDDEASMDLAPSQTLVEPDVWTVDLDWSPDGQQLAAAGSDGTVRVWPIDDGAAGDPIRVPLHDGSVEAVAWSPDGAQLASGGVDQRVVVWDLATTEVVWQASDHTGEVTAVDWSSGETPLLASADKAGEVKIWDQDGEPLLSFVAHDDWVRDLAWSPQSTALVTAGAEGSAVVWDGVSGTEVARLDVGADPIGGVGWEPTGGLVMVGTSAGTVVPWLVGDDSVQTGLSGLQFQVGDLAWSPNGEALAIGVGDGSLQIWSGVAG